MTTTLAEMGEKPKGQRPMSGQRVAEPAAYLTRIPISHAHVAMVLSGHDEGIIPAEGSNQAYHGLLELTWQTVEVGS